MKERRRCHRMDIELPVNFRVTKLQRHLSVGLTINISAVGLCFQTTEQVSAGNELTLTIQLPTDEKLELNTLVMWVRESGYISRDYFVGVRIEEPLNDDAKKFVKFCAERMKYLRGNIPSGN